MSWIDLLDYNTFLKSLYPTGGPCLQSVFLHEVQLLEYTPSVSLRFDLSEYTVLPPVKWRSAMGNTVQVRVVGVGVRALELRGWTFNNSGRLSFEKVVGGVITVFESGGCHMTATFEHIRVDSVTSYLKLP